VGEQGDAMDERKRKAIGIFLSRGEWFGGLPGELQEEILRRSVLRRFARGHFIQREGEPALGLVAVLDGRVMSVAGVKEHQEDLLYVGGRGFWFGEQALLSGGKLLASVVALTAVEVLLLPRAEFERIVEAEPRHYRRFALLALQRSALFLRFLGGARRLSPEDRVRLRLANLAELRRLEVTVVGEAVTLELSQTQLASMLGLSRQNLNRRLRRLQAEGWVELKRGRIRVLDPEGLRATVTGGPRLDAVTDDARPRRGR